MSRLKLITLVVVVILSIVIVLQNTTMVSTRFLFIEVEMPIAVLLLVTLLLGVIAGVLLAHRFGRSPNKDAAKK